MNLFVGGHFLKFDKCKSSVGGKNILRIDKSSALVFGTLENVGTWFRFRICEAVFLFRCTSTYYLTRYLRNIHYMFFYWVVIIQNPLFYDRLSSKSTLPVLKIAKRGFSIVWLAILMELVVNGPINQEHTMGRNILWKSSHFCSATAMSRDISSTFLLYS